VAVALSPPAVNGFEMYLEEAGQPIAGRNVELIVEDTAGNPGTAITKFRKFVESDQVDMVVGEVSRSTARCPPTSPRRATRARAGR